MANPNIKNWGFGSPNRTKEQDDKIRAKGMEVRQSNIGKPRKWTDEKIAEFIDELLDVYKKILIDSEKIEQGNPRRLKQETIMDMNTMVNRLLQFKEKYYPPVQKSINLNIDMTVDAVIERLRELKKKRGIVIIEEVEKVENLANVE